MQEALDVEIAVQQTQARRGFAVAREGAAQQQHGAAIACALNAGLVPVVIPGLAPAVGEGKTDVDLKTVEWGLGSNSGLQLVGLDGKFDQVAVQQQGVRDDVVVGVGGFVKGRSADVQAGWLKEGTVKNQIALQTAHTLRAQATKQRPQAVPAQVGVAAAAQVEWAAQGAAFDVTLTQ